MRWLGARAAPWLLAAVLGPVLAADDLVPWEPRYRPPPPAEDEDLVPWSPSVLALVRAEREPRGAELERALKDASAYHRTVAAAWKRRSRARRTVLVEDLVLDAEGLAGKPLAVLAIPDRVTVAALRPSCELGGGKEGATMPASLATLSVESRRRLLYAAADEAHAMLFLGTLRRAGEQGWYFDAEGFEDLGAIPRWTVQEAYVLLRSSAPYRSKRQEEREAMDRTARVMNDREFPYVPLAKLIEKPEDHVGRPLATIGFCDFPSIVAAGATPNCNFKEAYYGIVFGGNALQVLLSRLDRGRMAALLRGRHFGHGWAARGRVRKAANGAHYLEADSLEGVGFGSNVDMILNPEYFDSREHRDQLDAAHGGLLRARSEAAGWGVPLVGLDDLLLEPAAHRGKAIAILGESGYLHPSAAGLVGELRSGFRRRFPLKLASLDPQTRETAAAWERTHLLLLRATLREEEGFAYLDADRLVDCGRLPHSTSLREALEWSGERMRFKPEDAREAMRSTVAGLKRDPDRAYVLFEDLVLRPHRWLGKPLSVVGEITAFDVGSRVRHFKLSTHLLIGDDLVVSMDRLGLPGQREVLRLEDALRFAVVKGEMKTAPNGATFLEAESVHDLGPRWADVPLNEVR